MEDFERFPPHLTDNERDQSHVDFDKNISRLPENEVELLFTDISKIANSATSFIFY